MAWMVPIGSLSGRRNCPRMTVDGVSQDALVFFITKLALL
jgi:hypothetical protein